MGTRDWRLLSVGSHATTIRQHESVNYWLCLFRPDTWNRFRKHGARTIGFLERHERRVRQIIPGDILICYVVKSMSWCGAFEVTRPVFNDASPIFEDGIDPYRLRLMLSPLAVLSLDEGISVNELWNDLSRTRNADRNRQGWAYRARLVTSPLPIDIADGKTLVAALVARATSIPVLENMPSRMICGSDA